MHAIKRFIQIGTGSAPAHPPAHECGGAPGDGTAGTSQKSQREMDTGIPFFNPAKRGITTLFVYFLDG